VPGATIASLSLGVARDFQMRRGNEGPAEHTWALSHGDLLLMEGQIQLFYQHQVPVRRGIASPRVNLTFRRVRTPGEGVRLIIAGSRDLPADRAQALVAEGVRQVCRAFNIAVEDIGEVVSGNSGAVDLAGERFAQDFGLELQRFPADWSLWGKSAGPVRNRQMASYANDAGPRKGILLAVWDGVSKGTGNVIEEAKRFGLRVHIVRSEQ
jgi:hypothetical protein